MDGQLMHLTTSELVHFILYLYNCVTSEESVKVECWREILWPI